MHFPASLESLCYFVWTAEGSHTAQEDQLVLIRPARLRLWLVGFIGLPLNAWLKLLALAHVPSISHLSWIDIVQVICFFFKFIYYFDTYQNIVPTFWYHFIPTTINLKVQSLSTLFCILPYQKLIIAGSGSGRHYCHECCCAIWYSYSLSHGVFLILLRVLSHYGWFCKSMSRIVITATTTKKINK